MSSSTRKKVFKALSKRMNRKFGRGKTSSDQRRMRSEMSRQDKRKLAKTMRKMSKFDTSDKADF